MSADAIRNYQIIQLLFLGMKKTAVTGGLNE